MTRAEIKSKFDEIVEFSEIGRFLDTPVKRYSSGMYVRLAFAVAAHLEPEILIVDEVLAVGDAELSEEVPRQDGGRRRPRPHGPVRQPQHARDSEPLQQGDSARCGQSRELGRGRRGRDRLPRSSDGFKGVGRLGSGRGPGDDEFRLVGIQVLDSSGVVSGLVDSREPFSVRMEFDLSRVDAALVIGFELARSDGTVVMRTYQTDAAPDQWPTLGLGRNSIGCTIPAGLLNDGVYLVSPVVKIPGLRSISRNDGAVAFEVSRDTGDSPYAIRARPGAIAPLLPWRRM